MSALSCLKNIISRSRKNWIRRFEGFQYEFNFENGKKIIIEMTANDFLTIFGIYFNSQNRKESLINNSNNKNELSYKLLYDSTFSIAEFEKILDNIEFIQNVDTITLDTIVLAVFKSGKITIQFKNNQCSKLIELNQTVNGTYVFDHFVDDQSGKFFYDCDQISFPVNFSVRQNKEIIYSRQISEFQLENKAAFLNQFSQFFGINKSIQVVQKSAPAKTVKF